VDQPALPGGEHRGVDRHLPDRAAGQIEGESERPQVERLGAHSDGILRAFQPAVDGKPRNTAYYTILASEWPSVEAALRKKLG